MKSNEIRSTNLKISSRVDHDKVAKLGLKNKDRFKSFLEFGINTEKFNAIDFNRFEFIDTEISHKEISGKPRVVRADVMAKVGLKEMNTNALVGIITEHKSHAESEKELYLQGVRYNLGLLETKMCPVMTVILLHGKAPMNISSDLQTAFGWTTEMKGVFGDSGLNFSPDVVDLRKVSEDDIKDRAGSASALCYTLKDVWSMTQGKVKSVLSLCRSYTKDGPGYREYANLLIDYILQATDYSLDDLKEIEAEVIINEEERVMLSTYDRILEEGLQKGKQEGRQEGRQEGKQEGRKEGRQDGLKSVVLEMLKKKMDIPTIIECTGLPKEQILQLQKDANL